MNTIEYSTLEKALENTEGWYWENIWDVLDIDEEKEAEGNAVLTPDTFGAEYVTALYMDLYDSILYRGNHEDDDLLRNALRDVRVESTYWGVRIHLEGVRVVNIPKGWNGEEDEEDEDTDESA